MTDEALEAIIKASKESRMCCGNCGWFAVSGQDQLGECHRYPPSLDMPEGMEWKHPTTSRENVCGEFMHRRTGATFKMDPNRAMAARIAQLEDEVERLSRSR